MRRAFFFIVAIVFATSSFASIPRASLLDRASEDASALVAPLSETRIRVSEVLAPFERPAESELTRALRQAYGEASTTNASGLGRFLAVDPTWESADVTRPQSWNRYAYVENNPINKVDPDGRNPLGALIGGAIGVSIESYKQVTSGRPVDNRRLLAALAGGAVAGATGGLGGATLRGALGFGALGGVLGGATERGINKGEKIVDKAIVTDAVTGAVGGAAGQKLGQAMVRASQSSGTLNTLAIQGAAQRGEAAAANAGLGADRETARQAETLVRGITGGGDVAGNAAGEVVKSEINQVKKELDKPERHQ